MHVLEVRCWSAALVLSSLILGKTLQEIASAAIPVRLEGGVSIDDVRVPVNVHADGSLSVSSAVRLANAEPLQVEASKVTVSGPVPVTLPKAVPVASSSPIPVRVAADAPIAVAAAEPIPVSSGEPVKAIVDVCTVGLGPRSRSIQPP